MTVGLGGNGGWFPVTARGQPEAVRPAEPWPLTQTLPKPWMGHAGWAFRSPGLVSGSGMSPTPPCWLQLPLALSGELVHARGVNHVPWQPSRLRNRKEFKEKPPRYKSHPGPLSHLLPCGLGGSKPKEGSWRPNLCVYAPLTPSLSRGDSSEGDFEALTSASPPTPLASFS